MNDRTLFAPNPVWLASVALAYEAHAHKDAVPDAPAYPTTRREYVSTVGASVSGYLETGSRSHKNAMRRAVVEKFPAAFYRGYSDAGGDDTEAEDESWLTDKINAELQNLDGLFASLRELRGSDRDYDVDDVADERAEGYADTLDGVYSEGKLRGAGNVMLTWVLGNTEVHCESGNGKMGCAQLSGKRYSSKKWIKLGYKPRNPGNDNITCGGWKCDCSWELDNGDEFTA